MQKNPINIDLFLPKLRKLGLFIQDLKNNVSYPNQLWEEMGHTPEEMQNMGFLEFVHPDDKPALEESMKNLLEEKEDVIRSLFRMRSKNGTWRWILSTCLGVEFDENGSTLCYVGYDHDVTEEIEAKEIAEKALREAAILRSTGEIITSNLDLPDTIGAVLEQMERIITCSSASVQLLKGNQLEIIGETGFENDNSMIGTKFQITDNTPNYQIIKNKKSIVVNNNIKKNFPDFTDLSKTGIRSWMGIPLIYKDRVIGMMSFDHLEENQFSEEDCKLAQAFANQVAIALENASLYEEAMERVIHDDLTGCFSRGHLFSSLEREAEIANRYGAPLSLLMMDIDNFKQINDKFGHLTGDDVLKETVRLCSETLRKSDILARYGGEEFVALLPSSGLSEAVTAAERIRLSIEKNLVHPVTISIGCSCFRKEDFKNIDQFIKRADKALYKAKEKGKNRVEFY